MLKNRIKVNCIGLSFRFSLAGNSVLAPQAPESSVVSWTEVATSVGCTDRELLSKRQCVDKH